jgi:hypothetical protein
MYADNPARVLIGGTAVNMHASCKEAHDREQEGLTDAEIEGTANAEPPQKQHREEGTPEASDAT